jgi:hypothetical protein
MSHSPNNKNKDNININFIESQDKDNHKNPINNKASPIYNNKILTSDSSSTKNTNINASIKKDKDLLSYFSSELKPVIEEENNILENKFISKKKKIYKPPTIIDKKQITFQRQSDKKVLEFSLFDDELIFKDLNRSYLQDESSDDGDESSEEKINCGKLLLYQEIEESTKDLLNNLKKNQGEPILSRRMRFKNEKKD